MNLSQRIAPRLPILPVLALILSSCILEPCQARSCVAVPSSTGGVDEHQCTDDPLLLAQAVDPETGEQSGRYNLGLNQRIDGTESEKQAIRDVLERMEDYYINEVLSHPEYATARNRWYVMFLYVNGYKYLYRCGKVPWRLRVGRHVGLD